MYALTTGFSRKSKKGRPFSFKMKEKSSLLEKKENLFESQEARKKPMNIISLSYHFGKLTLEEFEIACFLENLCLKFQKNLGVKKIPSSSPSTWVTAVASSWNKLNVDANPSKAEITWNRIKSFVIQEEPEIANEFFGIVMKHYSYEELIEVKINTFSTSDILKKGVQAVKKMSDYGYL